MDKRCIMCREPAKFVIKNSSDTYCEECAIECFSDTSLLLHVEEQARELKELIKEKVQEKISDLDESEESSKESDEDST